ncbi:unnamed protein product, partial [marine sediment metagenome]
ERAREVLAGFVGRIEQVPPAYSAVHVDGRRAYELARAGKAAQLRPRTVEIHAIELLAFEEGRLTVDVTCAGGTYIRALARDVGAALGVGGYCARLKRTAVGPFTVEAAVAPEQLDPARDLLSPLKAVEHLPRLT